MTDQRGDAGPGIGGQIAEYGAELMRFREMLDLAFAGGARSSKSPEDRVVFPLLVSCRDIVEEILSALNDGFGRAALRSARTMYECVVTARYLNGSDTLLQALYKITLTNANKTLSEFGAFHLTSSENRKDCPAFPNDTNALLDVGVPHPSHASLARRCVPLCETRPAPSPPRR